MTATTAGSMAELDSQAASLLGQLQRLQGTPVDAQMLPEWLRTWSRMKGETQTLWAERLLAVKRNPNDAEAQALYKHLMTAWMPRLEAYDEPLARAALRAGVADFRPGLALKLEAELGGQHSEELREQLAQEQLLRSRYDEIIANQQVDFEGTSLTTHEAHRRLETTAEAQAREVVWQAIKRSDLATASELDALFLQLLRARQRVAVHAGSAHYAEHVWQQTNREYTIQEAVEFLDGIAEVFADLTARIDHDRAAQLGVERLRPWDLAVKPNTQASHTLEVSDFVATGERVLEHLDPAFGAVVRKMEAEGRFDLSPRPGKSGGNFAAHLFAYGTSEVVCNVRGGLRDFGTLLHELGHAVHAHFLSSNPDNLVWDYYDFMEVCEFCAFVVTSLGEARVTEDFHLGQDEQRWYRRSLAGSFLSRLRDVDERVRMELWLYQQTGDIATAEIDAHYLALYHRPAVEWSGHEDTLRKGWQKRHLFLYTFYNIEYSIATIAALLFVKAYQDDPQNAIVRLKRAMRTGATAGPTAIFAEAGVRFPFSKEQLVTARDVLADWLT